VLRLLIVDYHKLDRRTSPHSVLWRLILMSKVRNKKYVQTKIHILSGKSWHVTMKRLYQLSKMLSIIYHVCKIIQMVTLAVLSATVFEGCVHVRRIWQVFFSFLFLKFELVVPACLNLCYVLVYLALHVYLK